MKKDDIKKRTVFEGTYEDIIEIEDHFYIVNKKHKIGILPYTISDLGLLDKVVTILDYNYLSEDYDYTLIHDYISSDDDTNLLSANKILYNIINKNVIDAGKWMYLGALYNNMTSDSTVDIYAVDITDIDITNITSEENKDNKVKLLDLSFIVTTDDTLFLSGVLRLFHYFFIKSINKPKTEDNEPKGNKRPEKEAGNIRSV